MPQQQTIKDAITIKGRDLPSGNTSYLFLRPAPPGTGIVFETHGEQIRACLDNAFAMTFPCKTMILRGENRRIAVPEHLLAQLYAFRIDNVYVNMEKKPSATSVLFSRFRITAKNTDFLPYFWGDLCEALENNIEKQPGTKRKRLKLEEEIQTDKLVLMPNETEDLAVYAKIDYNLPRKAHIVQEAKIKVSPESMKQISNARSYCITASWAPRWLTKIASCFVFLSHGFGNGHDNTNIFHPVKTQEEWKKQELMPAEIACHTIMDRIGEIALLPGRVEGINLYCYGAGHKYALETLKLNQRKFRIIEN